MLLKFKTKIRRLVVRVLKLNKPACYPLISGNGFRSLANHFFDESSDFNPSAVGDRDIIFVRGDYLLEYFEKIHPKIGNKYILISHNNDTNITKEYEKYIDDKIIHWFAQNLHTNNLKLSPIPIGIYNNISGDIKNCLEKSKNNIFKKSRIAYSFSVQSNKIRISLLEILKINKLSEDISENNQLAYYKRLNQYKFVASPYGCGIDCHRTWEAIYLRTIPILIKDPMSEYFKTLGLPILLLNSWEEINNLTEEFLKNEYEKYYQKDLPQIHMDYWINEIMKYKNE